MNEAVFICDASGFQFPLDEAVKQWDGALVHKSHVDKRNPQDFIRSIPERQTLPLCRPEPDDVFLSGQVLPTDL